MPTTTMSKLNEALKHHQAGELPQAEETYRGILARHPRHAETLNLLGVLCSQTGRHDEAMRHLDRAVSAAPRAPGIHYNRGNVLRQLQRFEDALESYRRTIAGAPSNASAHFNLGLTLLDLDRTDDALDAFSDATKIDPRHLGAHDQRARILFERGDHQAAARHWQSAIEIDPNAAHVHLSLGQVLYHLGRVDESIACFSKVTQLDPSEPAGWCNLGAAMRNAGRSRAAIDALQEAIRLKPVLFEAHVTLVRSLLDIEDLPHALETCETMIELHPGAALPHQLKAQVFLHARELQAAEEQLRVALDLEPANAEILAELGDLLRAQGCFQEAASRYQQGLEIIPHSPDIRARRLEMYLERGQFDDATQEAKAVLREDAPDITLVSAAARTLLAGKDPVAAARMLEETLARCDLSPGQRGTLLFSLGDARDRVGEHDSAWEAYAEANRLKRARYDREGNREQVRAIIDFFDADRLQHLPQAKRGAVQPIFLAGMPRSGKTLVEQILDCHPDVRGGGEMSLMRRTMARLRSRMKAGEAFPACLASAGRTEIEELAAFANAELERVADGCERVVEATPSNFLFIGLIKLLLPSAKVVFCERDAADTCMSCYFKNFSGFHPYAYDLEDLAAHCRLHRHLMDHWLVMQLLPICTLPYEALVEDPERMTRQLLDFCDLQWSDKCLHPHENPRPVYTASAVEVRQPIYQRSMGRHLAYAHHLTPLLDALDAPEEQDESAPGQHAP